MSFKINKKTIIYYISMIIILSICFMIDIVSYSEESLSSSLSASESDTETLSGFLKAAENGDLALYYAEESTDIVLEDKRSSNFYYSTPTDREEDKYAQGVDKMLLASMVEIDYYDINKGTTSKSTSYASSVRKSGASVEKISGGVKITYLFERESITIPLELVLNEDHLVCRVNTEEIIENGDNRLTGINLLPYFGAGGMDDTGFLLVPDGSGSVINFNNGKSRAQLYSQEIYGSDATISRQIKKEITYQANLPVAGISSDKGGLFMIMTSGEALGRINAEVSRIRTSYNAVNFSFRLRGKDVFILGEDRWYSRQVDLYETGGFSNPLYEVRYYPMSSKENNYSDMAHIYRNYLMSEKNMKKVEDQGTAIYIELWGGIMKSKSVLGIPVNRFIPTTDFSDAAEIVSRIKDEGINSAVISYRNWSVNGAKDKNLKDLIPARELGGARDLKKLSELIVSSGYSIYLESDILKYSSNTDLISRYFKSVKQISGFPAKFNYYKSSTYLRDGSKPSFFMIKMKYLDKIADSRVSKTSDLGITGIGLGDAANFLYSDYSNKDSDMEDLALKIQNIMSDTRKKAGSLITRSPNAYALINSDFAAISPSFSSEYDIQDYSVPFYQMVIDGCVSYSLEPINMNGNPSDNFLRAIETAGAVSFVWTARNNKELKESAYDHLFSSEYRLWIEDAVNYAKSIEQVQKATDGTSIKDHMRLTERVYATEFMNGTVVIVNYNNDEIIHNGYEVPDKGFLIIEDGGGIFDEAD
ncbi:hypothetical protein EOM86_00860 [Candidatus Nomurabacteria bacterium]|nr:hypothetical protein [Candidatus Nomurabacteria bacterium]